MPRVPAVVDEHLGRLVLPADLQNLLIGLVRLAEVGTQPALPLVNLLHFDPSLAAGRERE